MATPRSRAAEYSRECAAFLAAALAACGGSDSASIGIRLHAPPPSSSGRCPEAAPPVPITRGTDQPTMVRLTFRNTGAGGAIVCDTVLPLDNGSKLVGIPDADGPLPRLDVQVEAFTGDATTGATLVGSGIASNLEIGAGGEVGVFVAPRERFGCASGRMRFARAFHSATTLPNGEVLVLGGIVADPDDPGVTEVNVGLVDGTTAVGTLFATDAVERYDPTTATFAEVQVAGLTPRAFHEAYLMPGGGPTYEILLVGGVTSETTTRPVVDGVHDAQEIMRFVPAPAAVAAPTELATYDPATGTLTAQVVDTQAFTPRMLGGATRPPEAAELARLSTGQPDAFLQWPLVVAGGWQVAGSTDTTTFEFGDAAYAIRAGGGSLAEPNVRVGASVTRLDSGKALVWGGNVTSSAGQEAAGVAQIARGLDETTAAEAKSAPVTVSPDPGTGSPGTARAFHTATLVGTDQVLLVGGFEITAGSAFTPVSVFAALAAASHDSSTDSYAVMVTNLANPEGALPVGYHDTIRVLGGDVLVTGGNYAAQSTDTCGWYCPTANAYRGDAAGLTLLSSGLVVPRYGHRAATLLDGTVVVTGGFGQDAGLVILGDAETFNPRTEAMDLAADDPGLVAGTIVRVPGDWARNQADGSLYQPCTVRDY